MGVLEHKWCIYDDDGNCLLGGYDTEEDAEIAQSEQQNVGWLPMDTYVANSDKVIEKKGLIL